MATVESSNVQSDDKVNNDESFVKAENDDQPGNTNNNDNNGNNISTDSDNDENKTNLIVNYLPQQMSDEEFENLFNKFGPMKSCKIVRNRSTGYSYGFGFVDFETHEQALKAIEELNGRELETKQIKVAFARPAGKDIKQANLYIKNIPKEWGQDDVRKIFEPYGNIIQVRVLGNDRGVAFVLYDLRKQAEDALEALNNKTVEGGTAPLEIKFAADKKSGDKGGAAKNNNGGNNTGGGNRPRERTRGGRNRGNRNNQNQSRSQGRPQRSFFDTQRDNNRQRSSSSGGNNMNQFNQSGQYSGGNQYGGSFNNMDSIGPVRQNLNRMNRYTPFIPVNQPMGAMAPAPQVQMTAQMMPQAVQAYGYTTPTAQQQMIPYAMMQAQQPMATAGPTLQPSINQAGQMTAQTQMNMYAAQMPMTYAPIAQNAMSNMYSVASNNMTNAANMQPQFNQQMNTMRQASTSVGRKNDGGVGDGDGITLFVYNIGPDSDEAELRGMFAPYGHVVKCNVVRKTPGGETKGFGFVTLKDRDQANSAIAGLNGSMKNGRTLQVSFKK